MTTLLPRGETGVRTPTPRAAAPQVTVNGVGIPPNAIAMEMQNHPAPSFAESWQAAAAALAIREVLLQEAGRLGIAAGPVPDAGRQAAEAEATIDWLIRREVTVPAPSEDDLRRFHLANPALFTSPDVVEASHILVRARQDDASAFAAARGRAEEIAEALYARPGAFADLARAHSDCASAAAGGALGPVALDETTGEFAAAIETLAEGEATRLPVEARYGFHLIRLDRRLRGELLPFDEVRDLVAAHAMRSAERSALAEYLRRLVSAAAISGIDLALTAGKEPATRSRQLSS